MTAEHFVMGMMVAAFKQVGIVVSFSDLMNMLVKTATSWCTHVFWSRPGTPSVELLAVDVKLNLLNLVLVQCH